MCKHELKDLMGVAGGVICRKCGQRFDHIPKQETEAKPKAEKAPEVKSEAEEKPKKAPVKKTAKKGAK